MSGGTSRIKMDGLRAVYESIGLKDARTLLQSGNVVFRSTLKDRERLGKRITQELERQLELHAEVIVRTLAELADIVERGPVLSPKRRPEQADRHVSLPRSGTLPRRQRSANGTKGRRCSRCAGRRSISIIPRGCRTIEALGCGHREQAEYVGHGAQLEHAEEAARDRASARGSGAGPAADRVTSFERFDAVCAVRSGRAACRSASHARDGTRRLPPACTARAAARRSA